jgi:hypothetical protein
MHPDLKEYLPEPQGNEGNERLPERDFFYKVFFKLHPESVESLIKQAAEARKPAAKNLNEQQWEMKVSEVWMEELLKHDYISCKFILNIIDFILIFRQEIRWIKQFASQSSLERSQEKKDERWLGSCSRTC